MGKVMQLAVYRNFIEYECWVCGIPFALSSQLDDALRRKERTFFCPAGCRLAFGESEETKLRRQLEERERQLAFERQRAETNFSARVKAERQVKTLKKRAAGGVCPCCQRSFGSLARHMKAKHPDYVAEASK